MDGNGRNKRTFITRLWIFVFSIIAFVFLIATFISVISPLIKPTTFVWTAYFGLAFWLFIIIDLFSLFVLLILRSKRVVIPIVALLIALPGLKNSYATAARTDGDGIKVMTYNLKNFRMPSGNNDQDLMLKKNAEKMIALINEQNPDVLCLQEFGWYDEAIGRVKCIEQMASKIGMKHVYYNTIANYGGNVLMSRYPIKDVENNVLNKSQRLGFLKKIDAGSRGSFYICNVHLTSYSITEEEIEFIVDTKNHVDDSEMYGKSIFYKLKGGFERRTLDTDKLISNLPIDNLPLVVCGDFNETPLSYTYHKIKRFGLTDSFLESGRGIGTSYSGRLPLLRIDYIWHNDKIKSMKAETIRVKYSDHYPLMVTLIIVQ